MVPAQDQPPSEGNQEPTFMDKVQEQFGVEAPPEETPPAEEPPTEPVNEEPTPPRHGAIREGDQGAEMFVKVNGVGDWIPMAEVADGFSYKRHNTQESQRIAKERKDIEDLKKELLTQSRQAPVREEPDPDKFPPIDDDDFYSKPRDAVDRMISQRLDELTKPLQEKISALEKDREAESKKLKFEREIVALKTQRGMEGFDQNAVERYLARMPDDQARKYEHSLGYKLAWLELKNESANNGALKTPPPPTQERVAGPGRGRKRMKIPEKITSTDEIAALLEGNLESFARK